MRRLALALLLALPLFAATPNNDDSCDIGQLPAATLLLPYFEVDLDDPHGETTLFSITNVTHVEQVAHVTLWTDLAVPVADFDIFLTGYDVQSINLYDVLARGVIAPPFGTGFEQRGSRTGEFSSDDANPLVDEKSCRNLSNAFSAEERERLRRAFTQGVIEGCATAGGVHENAVGYATIDVVRGCFSPTANEPGFVEMLLFDNVLTGDYVQTHSRDFSSQGAPMVHIRAIPEGGGATTLDRTFYSAQQRGVNRTRDARQPLPSTFAARWVDGGPGQFKTKLKVWREKISGRRCEALPSVTELVRFNERGQSTRFAREMPSFPATSLVDIGDPELIPANVTGDLAGWTYLNLGAQAWVVSSMRAEGRFSVDVEATALGSGCSLPPLRGAEIGPAPENDSCDIALLPAATLLLPYFEVDTRFQNGENTLVTVTNTSASPRIAHVTLWTDYAFPVVSFDVALGAYEVRSISLYDVIALGRIPAACGPDVLPESARMRMLQAFTLGRIPPQSGAPACNNIGSASHENNNAHGYATIDLVQSCTTLDPTVAQYYDTIAFDNVLTGDYQRLNAAQDFAQGSPLVHIRAVDALERTFYERFTQRDARQPLPSTFAARWISGTTGEFRTAVTIWREGSTGTGEACSEYAGNVELYTEMVTFDEEENAAGFDPDPPCVVCVPAYHGLPASASYDFSPDHDTFPQVEGAIAGWLYLNLAEDEPGQPARQAWVTSAMRAEGRYSIESTAIALGNGCSPAAARSQATRGYATIGPAPDRNEP